MKRVIPHALTFSPGVHPTDRRLRMPLLEAVIFSFLWAAGLGQFRLEQSEISISKERQKSASISCKMFNGNFNGAYIHWYRQKPGQSIEHLMYIQSTSSPAKHTVGGKNKFEATKNSRTSTSTLKVNFLEQEDEAMYYCACWVKPAGVWVKIFGGGTKLIVTERLDGDFSPKPTVFLPSIAEIEHHKAGTYLCLLENFFPDVIRVDWKEKNDNQILESQQGNTIRTDKTYMKFSWLTVTENSMDKEYKCVIKHEFNERGIDQEILFPSVNKAKEYLSNTFYKKSRVRREATKQGQQNILEYTTQFDESEQEKQMEEPVLDTMGQQLSSTSAYYAYLLLLLKSTIYFTITAFSLIRTTA